MHTAGQLHLWHGLPRMLDSRLKEYTLVHILLSTSEMPLKGHTEAALSVIS